MPSSDLKQFFVGVTTGQWALAAIVLTVGFWTTRAVYNLYFHPLAKFPGPRIAAITDAWYGYHWFSGRYPWAIEAAIKKYGDVVRIAPNELAFFTVEAQADILMSGTKGKPTFTKTEFYPVFGSVAGMAAEPDVEKHRIVRKSLAPAFSARALREMDHVLHEIVDEFVDQMGKHGSGPEGTEMSMWFDCIGCDLSGSLAYGHNFHNVRQGKPGNFLFAFRRSDLWGTLDQVMKRFPLLYPLVFLMLPPSLARIIPSLLKENYRIVRDRVQHRHDEKKVDYFRVLLAGDDQPPSDDFLVAHANHLIIGGLDPDTNLMSAINYFLMKHPEKLAKVQNEVRTTFKRYEDIDIDSLQYLPWLNAVIEESLRVHVNGSFGMPRYSPGGYVDGHFVPKGAKVQTASFAVNRSDRYWVKPHTFAPERFLPPTHPEYNAIFDKDVKEAFKPFSMGSRSCPGQAMAYRQIRLLMTKMMWMYDWEFVNEDSVDWFRDLRLYALWQRPDIYVRHTLVNHAKPKEVVEEK